jgi:hypothetical protein
MRGFVTQEDLDFPLRHALIMGFCNLFGLRLS